MDDGSGGIIAKPVGTIGGELPLAFSRVVAAPAVSATGAIDNDLAEVVKYAFTIVSTLGEETAPSNLSIGVKFNEEALHFSEPPPAIATDKAKIA